MLFCETGRFVTIPVSQLTDSTQLQRQQQHKSLWRDCIIVVACQQPEPVAYGTRTREPRGCAGFDCDLMLAVLTWPDFSKALVPIKLGQVRSEYNKISNLVIAQVMAWHCSDVRKPVCSRLLYHTRIFADTLARQEHCIARLLPSQLRMLLADFHHHHHLLLPRLLLLRESPPLGVVG